MSTFAYMKECGIMEKSVDLKITEKYLVPEGWNHPPMEIKLTFVGVGIL